MTAADLIVACCIVVAFGIGVIVGWTAWGDR